MSEWRRAASVVLGGIGVLCLMPPVYATILDWKNIHGELAWSHLDMLPCCIVLALPAFWAAWRIRR